MSGKVVFKSIDDVEDVDDFEKITDLPTAISQMKYWGIPTNSIRDKEEVIEKLIQHWVDKKKQTEHPPYPEPTPTNMALQQDLAKKCQETENFFKDLPQKLQFSLLKAFPDFLDTLRSRKDELCSGESTIIVAGEIGAGKSSLINLLLGTDLLPTHQVGCTNTVCEIRKSSSGRKEAVAFLKEGSEDEYNRDESKKKKISLEDLKGIQELHQWITGANEYDDSSFDKIKIYWPWNLGDGIVIVDTPGVEGGSNIDMTLHQYLSRAFGFIYVINTNAAGGVQHSRLGALLKTVVNSADDFSPEASLFIGNKWENIPPTDKVAVKDDIFQKLNKVYPGITEEQVHYISVTKVIHQTEPSRVHILGGTSSFTYLSWLLCCCCVPIFITTFPLNLSRMYPWLRYGVPSPVLVTSAEMFKRHQLKRKEHKDLLWKLEQLTYVSIRKGMSTQYSWLSSFLNKSLHLIRVANHKDSLSKDDLQKECDKLESQIKQLQKNTDYSLSELRRKIDYHIFKITKDITDILPSKTIMDSLLCWTEESCVKPNKKWKIVAEEASCFISKRIQQVIDDWERNNNILKRIDEEIVEVFAKEFGLMEHQIQDLEESMYRSRDRNETVSVKAVFKRKVKQIEKTYRTLGGAVSCVGGLDTSKKVVRQAFKDYDKDRTGAMAKATVLYVETIMQQKDLQGKLRRFFNRYFVDIDAAAERIPGFLQADRQMIETMSQKLDEHIAVSQKYPVLSKDCKKHLSDLDTFFVNNIMTFDYNFRDISCDLSDELKIGSGSFANVYLGVMKANNQEVALKIANEVIQKSNVTDVLTEDKIMRDLSHKNVVRYYGASYKRKTKGITWIMVMELCRTSLKEFYIISREAQIPGDIPDSLPARGPAVRQMANHALQMCEGLAYIHEKGYTHRDLKMENVLLGVDGLIKISDVGVAKPTDLLTVTLKGSPAYMAPEVLLSSRNQDNKIDIYSLSFILWEMWYGRDVADIINDEVLGMDFAGDAMSKFKARQAEPDGGFRPSVTRVNKPPLEIINVLRYSWAVNPDKRPTAAMLVEFFKDFLNKIG